jgi:hypothetical protein
LKGIVPIVIIMSLVALIAGGMIFKLKYEDTKDQSAWNSVREMDQENALRATQALPLLNQYDELMRQNAVGTPQAQQVAGQIVNLFPEFRAPDAAGSIRLISSPKMRKLIIGYIRRG